MAKELVGEAQNLLIALVYWYWKFCQKSKKAKIQLRLSSSFNALLTKSRRTSSLCSLKKNAFYAATHFKEKAPPYSSPAPTPTTEM